MTITQESQHKSRVSITFEIAIAIFVLWLAFAIPLMAPILALPGAIAYFFRLRKNRTRQNMILLSVFVVAFLVSAGIDLTMISFGHGSIVITPGSANPPSGIHPVMTTAPTIPAG